MERRDVLKMLTAAPFLGLAGARAIPSQGPAAPLGHAWRVFEEPFLSEIAFPLGGIGTGTVSLGGRGELRDWEIANKPDKGHMLSNTFFALWFREEGVKYRPDLALLCFFPNDVFWCGEERYLRYAKPRLATDGEPESLPLRDVGEESWFTRHTALGKMLASPLPPTFRPAPASRSIPKEFGVFLTEEPDFIGAAWKKVGAAVRLFAAAARGAGAKPLALAIPDKTAVHADARERFGSGFGLGPASLDPERPSRRFLGICEYAGVPALDPLETFRAEAARGTRLYFEKDWHLTPAGNRVLADSLYGELVGLLPPPSEAPPAAATSEAVRSGIPAWVFVLVGIWAALSLGYALSYRDEPAWLAPIKALLFVALVSGIFWAAKFYAPGWLAGIAILALLGFVAFKSAGRIGTIAELLATFARRGHWYMLPLLAVMVSIGTLLIVAASSPFVAPFIYTLF